MLDIIPHFEKVTWQHMQQVGEQYSLLPYIYLILLFSLYWVSLYTSIHKQVYIYYILQSQYSEIIIYFFHISQLVRQLGPERRVSHDMAFLMAFLKGQRLNSCPSDQQSRALTTEPQLSHESPLPDLCYFKSLKTSITVSNMHLRTLGTNS